MNKRDINLLRTHIEMGTDTFFEETPVDRTKEEPRAQPEPAPLPQAQNLTQPETKAPSAQQEARTLADKAQNLEELKQMVVDFDGCELKKAAINTVFGDGNPNADVMLIGEGPGANEDKYGIPFCGQSGKLLDNIIKAMGFERQEVYITNSVFWRPPGNRRPTPEEIKICRPFVEKHIALVQPKIILLVGSTAVESVLDKKIPMSILKNEFFQYGNCYLENDIKTAVIFHPSYLLRQQSKKKEMWLDVLRIMENSAPWK
jgi:uracil-DNA glycosylase family 4